MIGGIFGAPAMWGATKPYQNQAFAQMGMAQQPAPAPEAKGPSFFGEGGTGRNIAGFIGDYLLQSSGMRPIYQPAMMQRRHAEQQQKLMQQQRQAELEDYRTKLGIKAQFEVPEAPKPGSYEWFQTATPEQIAQYTQYMDITNPVMATTWQGPQVVPRKTQGIGGPALGDIEAELKRRGVTF